MSDSGAVIPPPPASADEDADIDALTSPAPSADVASPQSPGDVTSQPMSPVAVEQTEDADEGEQQQQQQQQQPRPTPSPIRTSTPEAEQTDDQDETDATEPSASPAAVSPSRPAQLAPAVAHSTPTPSSQPSTSSSTTRQPTPPQSARQLPPHSPQQQAQPQQVVFSSSEYKPSTSLVAPAEKGAADASFWDIFSSSAPQLKLSRELVEWAPALDVPPPVTVLAGDWAKSASALMEADRATGHLPPYALRFGFVDELGEYHAMLEYTSESTAQSATSKNKRENKYTGRAREAAKEILSSIQHHRVGAHQRQGRTASIGGHVVANSNVALPSASSGAQSTPPTPSSAAGVVVPSPQHAGGLSVHPPSTPQYLATPVVFSPPPAGAAATSGIFPRADLPETNWWMLTAGDGI